MNQLTNNLTNFSNNFSRVADALSAIFTTNDCIISCSYKLEKTKTQQLLFHNVTFGYPDKEILFKDLTVSIKYGEKIGLVGFSGSGKSTFISLILRICNTISGQIFIDQTPINEISTDILRNNISAVTQEIILFDNTVFYNIIYGNIKASREKVIKAAKLACIHEFIMTLPDQYDTYVGSKGVNFSGGEKQRIMLARAFIKDANIYLLDEATSQLDPVTEQRIQKRLHKFAKNKTIIIISHRLSTLMHMDRILVFDKGAIVQDAKHSELLLQHGLYHDLWRAQMNRSAED